LTEQGHLVVFEMLSVPQLAVALTEVVIPVRACIDHFLLAYLFLPPLQIHSYSCYFTEFRCV
jgi:hypothetical protein